jgi:TM2 domain-containing membrane protein YozV
MTFHSPSDRLVSLLGNFFLLRRIDGFRLGRALWFLALLVYGSMILIQISSTIETISILPAQALRFGVFYNAAFTVLTMLIYILMVRLAIEVAFSWLAKVTK